MVAGREGPASVRVLVSAERRGGASGKARVHQGTLSSPEVNAGIPATCWCGERYGYDRSVCFIMVGLRHRSAGC